MASFSAGVHTQGNGPSNDPVISGSGQFIALGCLGVVTNGSIRDIYLWNAPAHKGGSGNVSRESRPGPKGAFNGPSTSPALSSHGNFVAFASSEVGALPNDSSALPKLLIRYLGGK